MASLLELVSVGDSTPSVDETGLDAATLAFINEMGGVVAP